MAKYKIDTAESFSEFVEYLRESNYLINPEELSPGRIIKMDGNEFILEYSVYADKPQNNPSIVNIRQNPEKVSYKYDPVIFGKDQTENIVSVVAEETTAYIYREVGGKVTCDIHVAKPWIIGTGKPKMGGKSLAGNLFYKYFKEFDSFEEYKKTKGMMYGKQLEFYTVNSQAEGYMAVSGVTYFKGMKFDEVSVLSFDIETTGLHADLPDAKVLLISNTYRSGTKIIKKLFSLDEFKYEQDMISAWVGWVQQQDPSIIIGHNIYGFDLPYLNQRMDILTQTGLLIGRDNSEIKFAEKPSKKRKDGSQEYEYFKVSCHGRELIDTWFLAIGYDNIRKQYPSLGLKQIVKFEYEHALEVKEPTTLQKRLIELQKDRQFYDGGKIRDNWNDLNERVKIKKYCQDDSDEALYLYDLMAAPLFYQTQSVPKTFQAMTESASGTQINSLMVRCYLQEGHSLPRAEEQMPYQGAVSFGLPGRYTNAFKIDAGALYPSIMLQYQVCAIAKDPKKYFLKTLEFFYNERAKNKKIAKETGSEYAQTLSDTYKQFQNSYYGFLGSKGLLFNSPDHAAFVTQKGREVLDTVCNWATGKSLDEWKSQLEDKDEDVKED